MFESTKKELYSRIDFEALKKKEEIDYIAQVSEQYWDKFVDLLNCQEQISKNELEKKVFDETKKSLNLLGGHCCSRGAEIYGKEINESFVVSSLGWLIPQVISEEDDCYTLYLSKQGFEIIDGLKMIQEKQPITIEEANEKVRKRMFPE